MARGDEHMEVDMLDTSNCHAPPSKRLVAILDAGSEGEGLPYAPDGWPHTGDKWRWKVGKRTTASGYWSDRYIYAPSRLGSKMFMSKRSLEDHIRKEYPDADMNAFFSSFSWKIPCSDSTQRKEKDHYSFTSRRKLDVNEQSRSESPIRDGDCKARNKMCTLNVKARSCGLESKACDICCSEDGFCHDCCCILCRRSIDWAYGGYSFIRCKTNLEDNYICGHVAHIDCALRCYMAGTVGGSIGLDVQYYCRCCHNTTDLIPHVTKFIETCECYIKENCKDSRDEIPKILNLGLCLLRGSEKATSRNLRNQIERVMAEVSGRVHPVEIRKVEDNIQAFNSGDEPQEESEETMIE